MATQAEALAAQVEAAYRDLIGAVEGCSDADWRKRSASEGWPVGVLAHHVAVSCPPIAAMVRAVANGEEPDVPSPDELNALNARRAQEYAHVGKEETLDALRRNGDAAAAMVRGLTEAELALTSTVFGGQEMTVAQLVEGAVIGHPQEHLASIRAALAS